MKKKTEKKVRSYKLEELIQKELFTNNKLHDIMLIYYLIITSTATNVIIFYHCIITIITGEWRKSPKTCLEYYG